MSRENPRWGHLRIRGALFKRGHEIGRNAIKRILLEHGIDPIRRKWMSWETFLKAQCGGGHIVSEYRGNRLLLRRDAHAGGLVRYFVLFHIDVKTRRVEIAGIIQQPEKTWMKQIARNLTDCEAGFLNGSRHLIHDRDPLFTRLVRESGFCASL